MGSMAREGSNTVKRGLGRAILHGIIKDGLVTAHSKGLCVWSVRTDEVLEAIVEDWKHNSKLCPCCGNHMLTLIEEDGVMKCVDCLRPDNEL